MYLFIKNLKCMKVLLFLNLNATSLYESRNVIVRHRNLYMVQIWSTVRKRAKRPWDTIVETTITISFLFFLFSTRPSPGLLPVLGPLKWYRRLHLT